MVGARSALATLWDIPDNAASVLISRFYRELQDPEVSKAIALKRAQVRLIRDSRKIHPFIWAPFLLINNWL